MSQKTPIAHFPLNEHAEEVIHNTPAKTQHLRFDNGCFFPENSSGIRLDDNKFANFGSKDFEISFEVRVPRKMTSVFGDVLSKFDAQQRTGFQVNVSGSSAGYCGMSNTGHLHFGIDDAYQGSWEDMGHPMQDNSLVSNTLVHRGELYAGIADAPDANKPAEVFRYAGSGEWQGMGDIHPDPAYRSIMSMLVHDEQIYAGTGAWDWNMAYNEVEGYERCDARVFVHEGDKNWRDTGKISDGCRVMSLSSFDGDLYAGIDTFDGGRVHKLDPSGQGWHELGSPDGKNLECLQVWNGDLYAATHGNFYRYEGGKHWKCIGKTPHNITQIHSLQVVEGTLWAGTWPQGYVLAYRDEHEWEVVGTLGVQDTNVENDPKNEVMDIKIHNSKVYAGLIPKAEVFRYEAGNFWSRMGNLVNRPDHDINQFRSWTRVTSLNSYQGKLVATTGTCTGNHKDIDTDRRSGRVMALQTGAMASHEYALEDRWTPVSCVRKGSQLEVHVDGKLSSASKIPDEQLFHLNNLNPLVIGNGAQNRFSGGIRELKLYQN